MQNAKKSIMARVCACLCDKQAGVHLCLYDGQAKLERDWKIELADTSLSMAEI
jgi:hypothetical protein